MKVFIIGLASFSALFYGCKSGLSENYPMDKKYWDVSDYDAAVRQIQFFTSKEEGYPRLSDPQTAPVFNKLVDKQNVSVVLEDEQLGLKHRNEMAQEFFRAARDIADVYQVLDIQDKYIYPVELQKAIEFNLHTQLLYFKLGNETIIQDALDPEASDIKRVVKSNEQTIANNFNIYIEFLTRESAFSDTALKEYAKMIDVYYPRLLGQFPQANYAKMKNTAKKVNEKISSPEIKAALTKLIESIEKES